MSQNAARHDPHARSEDEDLAEPQARKPERAQGRPPRQPVGRPLDGGGIGPDEPDVPGDPDQDELELIGDDDLSAADLGPAAPNFHDPDAGSGPIRKVAR
jgi:hypothetical protein